LRKEAIEVDQAVDAQLVREGEALAELARRTAMLDAISYAAAQIVGVEDWRIGIQELLNRLGRATDVSRVTLFEIHKGPDGQPAESCRYDWAEPGYARLSDDLRYHNIALAEPEGQLREWAAARQRGEIVQATLKDVTGETRQTFLEHGTQSFISVPIMLRSGMWGFLGLDDCRAERVWRALEIDVLKTAAALIAGAIERAEADEALRHSRERYALAARGANDGLWDWDLTNQRTYFSPRLYEILGLPEGTLASPKAFARQLRPKDAVVWRKYLAHCVAERRRKFEFEARLRSAPPTQRWVVIRGMIVYEHGAATRLVGSLRDITDRKGVEIDLRASEARVRAILDTAFDAIITIDSGGRIVEFNGAATRTFGHSRADAVGKTLADLIVPPIYRAAHQEGLKRYLETGKHSVLNRLIEVEALRADGSHIPVELSITEVPVAEGRLFTAVMRDISERKRFESQLAVAERQRAQLTRHFSPNMVEELMQAGGRIGVARTQPMAVLFADLYDYTEMSAAMSGEQVIALLREFHAIVEDAVFNHSGTLDKYIGDGLMATFGTPSPGPLDATNAIAATRQMLREIARWNQQREAAGERRIRIGVGLHFGMATLGDVGTDQRFELTVVGDTINIASRIEQLSRLVRTAVVASDDIIQRAIAESGVEAIESFRDLGEHRVRGRQALIRLWGLSAESQRP
jgi:PAS domain S-box-containing protein